MRIDLREIPVYIITVNAGRAHFAKHKLEQVGIVPTIVSGVRCSPGIIGCGLSHLKILRQVIEPPFLILEDDVTPTADFKPVIELPDDTAMAYLGVSTWGITPENPTVGTNGASSATRFNDDWLQVHRMLSSHAILWCSWEYATIRESLIDKIVEDIPFDVAFAELQQRWAVLTPNKPFFYQDARVGGNENDTRQPLIPVEVLSAS